MRLKVDFFALPDHYGDLATNLRKELDDILTMFPRAMEIFKTNTLSLKDYTLTILTKQDINYPYWSKPLDTDKVFSAMAKSEVMRRTKGNIKILLVPSTSDLDADGILVAGVAQSGTVSPKKQRNSVKMHNFLYRVTQKRCEFNNNQKLL